jgi:O-antigen biosynthesis protein
LPKMTHNGVILFHDIAVKEREFGVWKLWEELKSKYSYIEFPNSNGLGVIFLGKKLPIQVEELLNIEESKSNHFSIKKVFIQLGENIITKYEREGLLKEQEDYIKELKNSSSWKVTKPLRCISKLVKQKN